MKNPVFVSGNMQKVHYLEKFLGSKINHHKLDLTEVQSLDTLEVVKHKVLEAYRILQEPVLIEDTSLTFKALNGLPGPFIKYFLEEIGNEGMCRLLNSFDDRSAEASVTYGYYDGSDFKEFNATLTGNIPTKPRGNAGMGWDPIFIPDGQTKTYAEMDDAELAEYSLRNQAVKKLKNFLSL